MVSATPYHAMLDALDREGFALVPNALAPAWVGRLVRAFADNPAQSNGTQHVVIDASTPEIDAWRELERHPLLLVAAEHVLSSPFHVRDAHGRNPLPGFGQQGLHADWPVRLPGQPYQVLTALWLLDDFTAHNGATRVVPGSHLLTRTIVKSYAQPLAKHPDERRVVGAAGSVLILNGHLWHSGTRNDSTRPRRVVQMVVVKGIAPLSRNAAAATRAQA